MLATLMMTVLVAGASSETVIQSCECSLCTCTAQTENTVQAAAATAAPTPEPTAAPTPEPTTAPIPGPTAAPTPEPTTAKPAAAPTTTPKPVYKFFPGPKSFDEASRYCKTLMMELVSFRSIKDRNEGNFNMYQYYGFIADSIPDVSIFVSLLLRGDNCMLLAHRP